MGSNIAQEIKQSLEIKNQTKLITNISEISNIENVFLLIKKSKLYISNESKSVLVTSFFKNSIFFINDNKLLKTLYGFGLFKSHALKKINSEVDKLNYLIKNRLKAKH